MAFSYNPLWKILIDKGMTKEDLRTALNLSPNTIAKMGKGENISMSVLHRICEYFNCQPGIWSFIFLIRSTQEAGTMAKGKGKKKKQKRRSSGEGTIFGGKIGSGG